MLNLIPIQGLILGKVFTWGGGERIKGFLRKHHDNWHLGTKTLTLWPLPVGQPREAMVWVRSALTSCVTCPWSNSPSQSLIFSKAYTSQLKSHLPRCHLITKMIRYTPPWNSFLMMGALRSEIPLGPKIIEMYYGCSLGQVSLLSHFTQLPLFISHYSVSLM